MNVTVNLPGPLVPIAEGAGVVELALDGDTVADVLGALFARHPRLRDRIVDEQGRVRPHVNVFVDRASIRRTGGLLTKLADRCIVSVIPAVSGG